ncbi:MAG TPA: sugar kinase, partial [Gemmatimonadales bacterium]|nr:sugar kinase [Gemmatimonadales bacterium]
TSFDAFVGGSELNVAVAAARLGAAARWVSRLPDNALGHMIANRARAQGVDVQVEWVTEARAGLYFVEHGSTPRFSSVLYDRAGSAFSRVAPERIDWSSVFAGARWYHVSGITPALGEGAARVTAESLAAAKRAGLTVSYDLNYRQRLWSTAQACATQEPLLAHVDLLNTTAEDAELVFGARGDPEAVARALAQRFRISAVTVTVRDQPLAAVVASQGRVHTAHRFDVETVDRIGAGDAFTGGLIVSRLENKDWEEALRFATATAALKRTIAGDFCLVTREQVEQLVSL